MYRTNQTNSATASPVLEVKDLTVSFGDHHGRALAIENLTFTLQPGETLAIVGESGSGKSVTALSILGLISSPPGRIESGTIRFSGRDILGINEIELQKIRGNKIAMIFQEPMTSLNPVMTIGRQVTEAMIFHQGLSRKQAEKKGVALLNLVQIPEAEQRMRQYPHQMSGGMRQRVMIALALSCDPRVLIADEPTTALDVTVQAQILDLMADLKNQLGTAIIFITHDLGVVAEIANRVLFMYAGCIIEEGPVEEIFDKPIHPYSQGLMSAIPRLDRIRLSGGKLQHLSQMAGMVPSIYNRFEGCLFAPRCSHATEKCWTQRPYLFENNKSHRYACWEAKKWLTEMNGVTL